MRSRSAKASISSCTASRCSDHREGARKRPSALACRFLDAKTNNNYSENLVMRCSHAALWLLVSCLGALTAPSASAQATAPEPVTPETGKPASPGPETPPTPASWFSSIKLSAQIEGGATINPASPQDGLNFG